MPEYLSPGVYIEEIDTGPKPIAAVATSTAGAVGVALRGPTTPTLITNYGDFVRVYGGPLSIPDEATQGVWDQRGHYWQAAEAIKAFFDEGGARVYYQRVVPHGALASWVPFHGGLVAVLDADVAPADTQITLSHVFGINAGTWLTLVAGTGSQIGRVRALSVDRTTRVVTLSGAAGVSARRGDLAVITPVDGALDVLTASASSQGTWGDDLSVQIMPMVGARKTLTATPASGRKVLTQTTVDANQGDTGITVAAVVGSLDANTHTPFDVQINAGAPVTVNPVTDAPNLALTLATALPINLPPGSTLTFRPAGAGADITAHTTADANQGDTHITVTPVAGSLDANTQTPFDVHLDLPATVNVVADAPPNVTLTLGTALPAHLPTGSTLTFRPAGAGADVSTQTTADANQGDTHITVTPVAGSLDANTQTPFDVHIKLPVTVNAVADAPPNVTLTLATALAANLPRGSTVTVVRPAGAGAELTVSGADRLYPNAVVQLEGAAGTEIRVVDSVVGSQVRLTQAPVHAYAEGDTLSLLEAEVRVRYRPAGGTEETEHFAGLRLTNDPDPASLIAGVNLRSHWIRLAAGADYDATTLANFPAVTAGGWGALSGGNDALDTLTTADFIGVNPGPGQRTGIQALEEIDEVAICIVPGMWDADVQRELIVHCETLADRFAILDPPPDQSVQEVQQFRSPIDTTFAALYYPWVQIRNPRPGAGGAEDIAPSGFVAGVYARTDIARGVHKAPANEVLRSIRGLTQTITKREQDVLNPQNINVLRFFPGRGNRVWGARVLTSNASWRYVSVRRLFLMIEESIDEGTQWVVFEPNDEPLWARVRQSVSSFLTTQWRLGALQGATAAEAFFVACDRSTMTADDIDNGRLVCEIGIAPVKPAEFVIFRIQQKTLDAPTT